MFKKIPLFPTKFDLDVWVCDDLEELSKSFQIKYGASSEYYKDELKPDAVQFLDSTVESESGGDRVIVMNMQKIEDSVVVHEIAHVLFKLSDVVGIEVSSKSQEWCAYFMEYVYEEIMKMKPD